MKDYIRHIIRPWVQEKGREHNIKYPHCVLLLDCWSVHTSKDFRAWMPKPTLNSTSSMYPLAVLVRLSPQTSYYRGLSRRALSMNSPGG